MSMEKVTDMNKKIVGIVLGVTMMSGLAARSYADVPRVATTATFPYEVASIPIATGPVVPRPAGGNECLPALVIALAAMAYDYTQRKSIPTLPPIINPMPFKEAVFDRPVTH
jgi:hypothetical protein